MKMHRNEMLADLGRYVLSFGVFAARTIVLMLALPLARLARIASSVLLLVAGIQLLWLLAGAPRPLTWILFFAGTGLIFRVVAELLYVVVGHALPDNQSTLL